MTVQLTITGEHTTDVISELQMFASALSATTTAITSSPQVDTQPDMVSKAPPETVDEEPKPKKLTAKQQTKAVNDMIEAGEIDQENYNLLTKKNKGLVDEGLKPAEEAIDDMFGDEDEPEVEATVPVIRAYMEKISQNSKGEPVQDNLTAIRAELVKFVPKGESLKIGNIPEEKRQGFYNALVALGL